MALPRPHVHYEVTWPYYLKTKFINHDIVSLCYRNLTTNFLTNGWLGDSLEFYSPDVVIVQLGVVDCAPRFFISKGISRIIISKLPIFLRVKILNFIKRFYTRSTRYAEVSKVDFYNNIKQYIDRCQNLKVKKIIFIAIGNVDNTVAIKSPKFRKSIQAYNSILYETERLHENVCVVNPLVSDREELFCDGYHPSSIGHQRIFESVLKNYSFD